MSVSIVKSDEARNNWRALLDKVFADRDEVVVERYNKPLAVLVNYDVWDRMKKSHAAMLAQRAAEMDTGPEASIPWEVVKRGMIDRGLVDG